MSEHRQHTPLIYENLDTSYVNLAALLRYLQQRGFNGRVRVELEEYEADVLFTAGEPPQVRERDLAKNREAEGASAQHRLLVRAQEPGGLISVYENVDETVASGEPAPAIDTAAPHVPETVERGATTANKQPATSLSSEEAERAGAVQLSGELIAAVERAVAGADFAAAFRTARLSVADDYAFLDPLAGRFEYAGGVARLHTPANIGLFVAGISEALRRAVDRVAASAGEGTVRHEVARELATLARKREKDLTRFKFMPHLERIAGARLL